MTEEATVVGVVDETESGALAERLESDRLVVRVGEPGTFDDDLDLVVAVGEEAIVDVVAAGPSVPLVPIDAGAGIRSVPATAVNTLADEIERGHWESERHHPLAVAVSDDRVDTAVFDVTLVTTEAARISEYSVRLDDGRTLDGARADGVVVATPAGSKEYARRVEAPVLAPETGIAVAWIAPFRSDPDRWVVDPTSLSIGVERDDAAVDLLVDGHVARTVGPDDAVTVTRERAIEVAVFDASLDRHD